MPHVKIWVLPDTPNIPEKCFELDVDPISYRTHLPVKPWATDEIDLTVDGLKEQLATVGGLRADCADEIPTHAMHLFFWGQHLLEGKRALRSYGVGFNMKPHVCLLVKRSAARRKRRRMPESFRRVCAPRPEEEHHLA